MFHLMAMNYTISKNKMCPSIKHPVHFLKGRPSKFMKLVNASGYLPGGAAYLPPDSRLNEHSKELMDSETD